MKNYLDFEKEIKALEQEVDSLKSPFGSEGISEVDTNKIKDTQREINQKLDEIYSNLNSWQKTQVARHEDRPKANFYIKKIFSQFTLLSGESFSGRSPESSADDQPPSSRAIFSGVPNRSLGALSCSPIRLILG